MKTLYVLGQSTCYGMDITPRKSGMSMRTYRETYNFAGLLGKQMGYQVVNSSYPMNSLSTIIRKIKEEYDLVNPSLVIVGIPQSTLREMWDPVKNKFINLMQKEFYFPDTVLQLTPTGVPTIYDTDVQRQAYIAYRTGLTIDRAIADFEKDIIELQTFLKSRNSKYIFLQMAPIIPNQIDEYGYTDNEGTIKQFAKYFTRLDEINTGAWIGFDKFNVVDNMMHLPKGKTGHILEEGHEILKDLIYDRISST
jgi:hypothetical protein